MEEGYCKGEICNRDGCQGVINAHEKEGGCSCHLNPPCGYCTEQTEYCPVCDWSAAEEKSEYEKQQAEKYKNVEPYKPKTLANLDTSKIDYISAGFGTGRTVEGCYPITMSETEARQEILKVLGADKYTMPMFKYLGNGKFKLTMFTD